MHDQSLVRSKCHSGTDCTGVNARSSRVVVLTYNNPVKFESVEIDEALKAGHVVDPANEIQL